MRSLCGGCGNETRGRKHQGAGFSVELATQSDRLDVLDSGTRRACSTYVEPAEPVSPSNLLHGGRAVECVVVAAKHDANSSVAFQRDVDMTPSGVGTRSTQPDIGAPLISDASSCLGRVPNLSEGWATRRQKRWNWPRAGGALSAIGLALVVASLAGI